MGQPDVCSQHQRGHLLWPPPNGAVPPSTLGGEGDGDHNAQRKDNIITAERTKYAWLHFQGVGPLQNNIRKTPITMINVQVSL